MKTVYVGIDEYIYHCPYCGIEIGDLTGDEIESGTEYCPRCYSELEIEVIE